MAVSRASQSTIKQGLDKSKNFIAGIPPILGRFESIQTITVGSGGASSIEFTSIPGTYQHLQLRWVMRSTRTVFGGIYENFNATVNGSATGYAVHSLYGDGASVSATGGASQFSMDLFLAGGDLSGANVFGVGVLDILDYASTSKTKTFRCFSGVDNNGSGSLSVSSGLWNNTSAITSIKFVPYSTYTWKQHSTAALYGIKAP